jgi:hypothetical protein
MSIEIMDARPARWLRWTLGVAAALVVAGGCVTVDEKDDDGGTSGSSGGGAPTGSGNGSGAGSGSGTASGGGAWECCLPSGNYACPNEAAFDACVGFDIDGCLDACALDDFMCQDACFDELLGATHDPSGCVADAAVDCESSGPGPSSSSGGNSSSTGGDPQCSDILSGCDYDDDCCSNNCTSNTCYGNDFGSPCDYDDDCDSTNCYDGSCQ